MAEKPDAANLTQLRRVPPTIEVGVFPDWFSQAGPAARDYQHWITCVVSEA
jgi:hypothetical protein